MLKTRLNKNHIFENVLILDIIKINKLNLKFI